MNKNIKDSDETQVINYINNILSQTEELSQYQDKIFKDLIIPHGFYINKNINSNEIVKKNSIINKNDNNCINNNIFDNFIDLVSLNNAVKYNKTRKKLKHKKEPKKKNKNKTKRKVK